MFDVLLLREGDESPSESVHAFWKTLRDELCWLPAWFGPKRLQRIMAYLDEQLTADELITEFVSTLCAGAGVQFHIDVTRSICGTRRVFIGPLGCSGIPRDDLKPHQNGGANFFWVRPKTGRPEMYMTVYPSMTEVAAM